MERGKARINSIVLYCMCRYCWDLIVVLIYRYIQIIDVG